MDSGAAKPKLTMRVWAEPSTNTTLEELIAELAPQGVVLAVDYDSGRVLVAQSEQEIADG